MLKEYGGSFDGTASMISSSACPLPKELQKQRFNLLVAAQAVQIGGKLFAIERNFLRWGCHALHSFVPRFTPCCVKSLAVSQPLEEGTGGQYAASWLC